MATSTASTEKNARESSIEIAVKLFLRTLYPYSARVKTLYCSSQRTFCSATGTQTNIQLELVRFLGKPAIRVAKAGFVRLRLYHSISARIEFGSVEA